MTQVSKRLPVLLALLVGLAMAFAVWALPNAVYANDDEEVFELDQIEIQSDGTLGEGQKFILLADEDDTVSWGDLSVVVMDQGGNPVADSEYDLQLQAVWYSGAEHKDHLEDVTNQESFGLMGAEASSGCTEYRLTATPAENSDYVGGASLSFYLVDRTSLSYICSEISFENPDKVTGWRMRDWYWFWGGHPIRSVVRAECGFAEEPLTEDEDYTVTYYKHKEGADIYSGRPEEEFLGDKVTDNDGNPVVPTEPGNYFAVIKGTGNYYGGSMFPVSIMGDNQIMFKPENDMDLWSNGEKKYTLTKASGVVGDSVELTVGFRSENGWEETFTKGEDYTYDPTTSTLTLIGEKIVTEETKDNWLCLYAQIGEGDSALTGDEYVQLRLAEYHVDEPEDVELLPGWEKNIDRVHCFVRDPQHFDGEHFDQPIKNASIKSQDPADGEVLELWEENGEWKYRAKNPGRADIEIEFDDPLDQPVVCEFSVTVSDTVYNVDLWSEDNIYTGLPGDSITLFANAEKEWVFFDDDNPDDPRYDNTQDNLIYQWELTEGSDYATLTPDRNDPCRAILKFSAMPADLDHIGERIKVKVSVRDTDSDDPTVVRAERDNDFWISDDYYQIAPTTVDADLMIGRTTTLEPELRHYQLGKKYTVVDNVDFELNEYNDEDIQVTETDNVFKIKRLQRWDTNFRVEARWDGDPGWTDQWYHLNGRNYRAEFGRGNIDVYDDDTNGVTLTPDIQDGEGLEDSEYTVDYKVGRCKWNDEDGTYDWDYEVDPDSGAYKVSGKSITIYGDKLAQLDRDNLKDLRIIAQLKINGIECESTDCWIDLRESCVTWGEQHNWIKSVVKNPTLTEVGYEFWICPDFMFLTGCGEARIVEIPKLIDISGASVSAVKDQTYTGTAVTPALTVKVGETALKAGTDYTAAYTNNTNVGTATVTLTGKGKYGGTKEATFKIAKAANPMVVKTKAVKLKAKDVKKKNKIIKTTAAFAVTQNQGKLTYKKKSGNAKITIAANGKITVKKGLKKGKYKFVVNVTAAGNANYNKITKAATVNIIVK